MVFKWREEHTPVFLEHYKNYPCLWNHKVEGYNSRYLRANAIRSLFKDLNIDGVSEEDIKLKIKSIRTRYTCELSKIKRSMKSGCSVDDVYVPRLFWFEQADEFLNAVCVPRESSSNINTSEQQLQVIENEDLEDEWRKTPEAQEWQETPQAHSSGESQLNEQPRTSILRVPKIRKRKYAKICKTMPRNRVIKQLKTISNDDMTENEFDLFCRSLAVQLKNMPLHRALLCQQKLQYVMVQERLKSITARSSYNLVENFQSPNSTCSSSQTSWTNVNSPNDIKEPYDTQPNSSPIYHIQSAHSKTPQKSMNNEHHNQTLPISQPTSRSELLETAIKSILNSVENQLIESINIISR